MSTPAVHQYEHSLLRRAMLVPVFQIMPTHVFWNEGGRGSHSTWPLKKWYSWRKCTLKPCPIEKVNLLIFTIFLQSKTVFSLSFVDGSFALASSSLTGGVWEGYLWVFTGIDDFNQCPVLRNVATQTSSGISDILWSVLFTF